MPKVYKKLALQFKYSETSAGQTLIETMVAVFMLAMGITAATGLAIFALNSSSGITKQIIATGLAREGIEAVRDMRDSNWLHDTLISTCYNYPDGKPTAKCYPNWLGTNGSNPYYCLDPSGNSGAACTGNKEQMTYNLGIDASAGSQYWVLDTQKTTANYGLDFDPAGTNGFYIPSNSVNGNSEYYREITLAKDTTSPFDKDVGPRLVVTVDVWWVDKKCPRVGVYTPGMKCSVELVSYLTNWKNY